VSCIITNKPFGFDADSDHEPDPGIILRNSYHCGIEAIERI